MGKRRRKSLLGKLIGKGYRGLSILNTLNVIASGNPTKIAKHVQRKRAVSIASHLIPHSGGKR